jgi:hypothetical protein
MVRVESTSRTTVVPIDDETVVPIDNETVDGPLMEASISGPGIKFVQPRTRQEPDFKAPLHQGNGPPEREFSVKQMIRQTSARIFGGNESTNAATKWMGLAGRKTSVILFGRASVVGNDIGGRRQSLMELQQNLKTTIEQTENPSPIVIDPNSLFMRRWDFFMVVLLGFTALVTPFEVAFLESGVDALFFINRMVDLGFFFDMIIQCFVKYFDPNTGQWVTNLHCIRLK